MASPRFPIEPFRERYVTPFGGVSMDLAAGEVGVNAIAIAENTRLVPGEDLVLVSSDLESGARPLLGRSLYRVIGLTEARAKALRMSPEGEVVFSSEDFGGSRERVFDALREGALVVLNATLSRWHAGAGANPGVFARRRFLLGHGE